MKRLVFFFCSGMLLGSATQAQQFINGGFEMSKMVVTCMDIPKNDFNNLMPGIKDAGTATSMYVGHKSCQKGDPVQGPYYGVLRYNPPSGNILVFKLDKEMTVGKEYSMALHYKIPADAPPADGGLRFGYSSDSLKTDSVSGSIAQVTTTTWKREVVKFTPKKAWKYVWFEVTALGGDPFTIYLDSLTMILPQSVTDVNATDYVSVSPNPSNGTVTLTLSEAATLPCRMQMYDVTGRLVYEKAGITGKQATVNLPDMVKGLFLVKLTDSDGLSSTTRLVLQ